LYKVAPSLPISFNTLTIDTHDSLNKIQYFKKIQFVYVEPTFLIIPFIIVVLLFLLVVVSKRRKK
jgi:hypothetical protein